MRSWLRSMTLHDRVAQLVVLPFYGDAPNRRSEEYQQYVRWVRTTHVGGLILLNRIHDGRTKYAEPYATAVFINRMQRLAKVPLLMAGDFERGDSMRVESKTLFPQAMAFAATRDPGLSRMEGEVTARQARALGIPWILAPVADVNNNPDNPIINIRAYSENPEEVVAHVRAFIEGAHSVRNKPVLVTAKHFPGHGDTATDTHLELAVNAANRERLEKVELVPFRAAIADGADSIMTAHIAIPALDDPSTPATLSQNILTGLLRKEMGFQGLISTDALDMHGITKHWKPGQAAVKAIQAGADILLMPTSVEESINAVVSAVRKGEISRERLDQSVTRVLAAKVKLGLARRRMVDLESLADDLDTPEDIEKAQEVADRAVTLVRNKGQVVPVSAAKNICFVLLTENRGSQQGRLFAAEVKRRMPNAKVTTVDPHASEADLAQVTAAASQCDGVVVGAFVSVSAYRGSVALAGGYPKLVGDLIAAGKPVTLVALGNPYLLRSFPGVSAYLTTYSTVPTSELAAVKALFGEMAITGKLPVTIPGLANYGDGMVLKPEAAGESR